MPATWVFTGDSVTHGAKHTLGWRDYTELFAERVRWERTRLRDAVVNTAVAGWKIGDIAQDLEWSVLRHRPECVSIMIGLNDCGAGYTGLHAFKDIYTGVVEGIRRESGAAVLLHTPNAVFPPAAGASAASFAGNVALYAAAVRELASIAGARLVDHHAVWQPLAESGALQHWLSHGCHPNEYGHRALVHTLFRALDLWDDASWTCQPMVPRISASPP